MSSKKVTKKIKKCNKSYRKDTFKLKILLNLSKILHKNCKIW